MLNKKLIIKEGLAYEEDSDLPFTSSFKEFYADGALNKGYMTFRFFITQ